MNLLIAFVLVALIGVWFASRNVSANIKPLLAVLALLALVLILLKFPSSGEKIADDIMLAERIAGRELGDAIEATAIGNGPLLVLTWRGGGFNPVPARLQGLKEALGGGRRLVYGGAFVAGMKVDKDFVKLDPLDLDGDLRSYLDSHQDIAAVVALRPIRIWDDLEGLSSPPFFIFADAVGWRPLLEAGLVKAAMTGQVRARGEIADAPSDLASFDYRLVTP